MAALRSIPPHPLSPLCESDGRVFERYGADGADGADGGYWWDGCGVDTQNNSKNCGPEKGNVACQFVIMDPAAVAPPIVGQTVVQVRAQLYWDACRSARVQPCGCGSDGCTAGEPSCV
jgi:hypothetical protein